MRGIYKLTNTVNGKCYIGQSDNLSNRIHYHATSLKGNNNKNKAMQNDYNECGQNVFEVEILELLLPGEDLNKREKYWINYYKSFLPEHGYNRTLGGIGGNSYMDCKSEDERNKIKQKSSENRMGKNNPLYNKHCYTDGKVIKYITDDLIEEYENNGWHKGVPDSVKEKEKLSTQGERNGFFGKTHSDVIKKKWSEDRKGNKNWNYGKVIYHKGTKQKYILPSEIPIYEADGWFPGICPEVRTKIKAKKRK